MATIYRARTPEGDNRAIKLMHASLMPDQDLLTKFLREGRILQTINTRFPDAPIVRVDTYGREDDRPDGRPYICLEYLEGTNLLTFLRAKGGALGVGETLEVVLEIAMGFVRRTAAACSTVISPRTT